MRASWRPPHIILKLDPKAGQAAVVNALRGPLAKLADNGRACGDCQACCATLMVDAVPELDPTPFVKQPGTRCEHQCKGGCSIYEKRPTNCEVYYCWWRIGWGNEEDRPDKLKVIIDASATQTGRLQGIPVVYVREIAPGVLDAATGKDRTVRNGPVGEVVTHWEGQGYAVFFYYWGEPAPTGGVAGPAVRKLMAQRGIIPNRRTT